MRIRRVADPFDVMASLGTGQLNAFHRERLGWLDYGAAPPITTVSPRERRNQTARVCKHGTEGTQDSKSYGR